MTVIWRRSPPDGAATAGVTFGRGLVASTADEVSADSGILSAAIASNLSDKEILDSFANKYGATVLAAPTTKGFNLVAWIAPFAVFLAALLGTILLVRHWSVGRTQAPVETHTPEMDALRERIRRETDAANGGF